MFFSFCIVILGDEPEITQVEKVPSEILPLDKTLNSKCYKNVDAKNKDGQKNKRQDSPIIKNKESRKSKYGSPLDESDSDSDEDSSSEYSDIDNHQNLQRKKCPRMSIPHQGSLQSLQRKIINGNLASN